VERELIILFYLLNQLNIKIYIFKKIKKINKKKRFFFFLFFYTAVINVNFKLYLYIQLLITINI